MSLLKAGQTVPLVAVIDCSIAGTFYVQATIRDPNENLLAVKNLTETQAGTFSDFSFQYPADHGLIRVDYKVYEDAFYTVPSDAFCPDSETFERFDDVPTTKEVIKIVGIIKTQFLKGFINTNTIRGEFRDQSVVGLIERQPPLVGKITGPYLIGVASCKV